jgi:hypothetical protein
MDSPLAREAADAMAETVRRMTPEQRLRAFASQCELMVRLRDAASGSVSGGETET